MEALGAVRQLQQEQLRKSQGIDYMTNPPIQVPTNLKNRDVDRLPGGVTYYDPSTGGAGIKTAFDVRLDLNHLLADIQDVRECISEAFYADLFTMMAGLDNTRMTTVEIAARNEEKMIMLGPVLERLHNELLDPLVSMTFSKMIRAGLVPPPPKALQGQELNVELVSVLAQAQKAVATNSIDRFVSGLGSLAVMKPDVLDKFDADEWVDRYSDMLGVAPSIIVASDKVALVRQQRAEQQAQAAKAQQMQAMANTASQLGRTPAPTQDNALGSALDAFSGYN
jgi:hypothetical protein